jgi:iron complex outermembrane receptor protein
MKSKLHANESRASRLLSAAIVVTLAGAAGAIQSAHAQSAETETATEPTTETETIGGLEEVVVTAQKREESIQDVPIAVTALTGDALQEQQIVDLRSMSNTIPNVQINSFANSPDSAVFTIRGVGVNDADPYVGTTVSVVVDGVVVGTNTAALVSLFDIDRVEILRGPQGTLFGANTTGGVVNVVTKQPTGEFGGEAQLLFGNYDRIDANASLNFPITDNLAGKISVLRTEREGYMTNTIDGDSSGDIEITTVRPYLKYTGDSWDATLIGEFVRTRNGSQPGLNISPADRFLSVPGYTDLGEPVFFRGQNRDQPDQNDRDTYGATLTMNFETGLGDWVSITNYREYEQDLYSDDDATENVWLQTRRQIDHKQWSQELRDTIQVTDDLQWLIGAFAFHQEYFLDQDGKLDGFVPGLGQPQTQDQENESLSAFTQLYWDVTDRWRLQAGLRYTYEETTARSTTANTLNPSGQATFEDDEFVLPGSSFVGEGEESWDEVGYKLGADFRLSDEVMFYGYFAHGFKSGGFTGRITFPEDIGPHDPEYVDTIELGIKSDLFDRRLRANLAAFFNKYDDMQIAQNITYPDGRNSARIINAAKAETKGVELELTALPIDNLTLSASVAYLDAEFEDFLTPQGTDLSGNKLQDSPEWQTVESISYTWPIADGGLNFFLQHSFTDEKYSYFTNLPLEKIDSLNLFNANIRWKAQDDRWSLGVYGRNLTDEEYYTQKLDFGVFVLAGVGAPREYGVDFTFNW